MNRQTLLIDEKDGRHAKIKIHLHNIFGEENTLAFDDANLGVKEVVTSENLVAFVHRNDLWPSSGVKLKISDGLADLLKAAILVIAYTGDPSGLRTPQLRKEVTEHGFEAANWFGINEGLNAGNIDSEAIEQIAKWAINDSRSEANLPSLLIYERKNQTIISLLILCQGYLAVGSEILGEAKWQDDENFAKALLRMGWLVLDKSDPSIYKLNPAVESLDLGSHEELPGIEYWIEPFQDAQSSELQATAKHLAELIDLEWKGSPPSGITNLTDRIKAIANEKSGTVELEIVARAYLAFQEQLEKRP